MDLTEYNIALEEAARIVERYGEDMLKPYGGSNPGWVPQTVDSIQTTCRMLAMTIRERKTRGDSL